MESRRQAEGDKTWRRYMAVKLSVSFSLSVLLFFIHTPGSSLQLRLSGSWFSYLSNWVLRSYSSLLSLFYCSVFDSCSRHAVLPAVFHTNTDWNHFCMFTSWRLQNRLTAVQEIRALSLFLSPRTYTVYILQTEPGLCVKVLPLLSIS